MLIEPLFQHARRAPTGVPDVIDDRGQYTYAQLAATAAGLAMYLSMRTQQPRVGVLLPASAAFAASFYGTLLAGKTVVPINFLLGDKEIAHVVKDSGIDAVITAPPLAARVQNVGLNVIDLTELQQQYASMLSGDGAKDLLANAAANLPTPSPDDLAVILYTSATTGLPKGVMLSYGNLQSDVDAAIAHGALKGEHSFLGIVPLFHSTGLLATLIAPVQLGARVVYQARFSPVAAVKAIREHQISLMAAVPSMYGAMARLKDAGPDDLKSLYAAISGGEPLPTAVREAFETKYNQPIYEGYGLTETIGPIAFNVPGARRPGAVGRVMGGAEARIVDEAGNPVPQGEVGEIWLRGPMIMKGYLNRPDATADAITPDGYFKSGDLGRLDADGYLFVTGRKKDLIISAGEKVSPREIEEVLGAHPSVAEAAVLGRPDPSRGEVVVAFVTAKEGETVKPDELRDFCRQHGLAQWKVPREVTVVPELPHSPTGKVLKRVLAEQFARP